MAISGTLNTVNVPSPSVSLQGDRNMTLRFSSDFNGTCKLQILNGGLNEWNDVESYTTANVDEVQVISTGKEPKSFRIICSTLVAGSVKYELG